MHIDGYEYQSAKDRLVYVGIYLETTSAPLS